MKLTDQNIPPNLRTLYENMVSTNQALLGGKKVSRTRKKVSKRPRKTRSIYYSEFYTLCARMVVDLRIARGEKLVPSVEIRAERKRLMQGIYDYDYWAEIPIAEEKSFRSLPVSADREFSPRYLYPDPLNRPSTPTYPAGVEVSGKPFYTGETTGTRFNDELLRWKRVRWDFDYDLLSKPWRPLFLRLAGYIDSSFSSRICKSFRAMSVWYRSCGNGDAPLADTAAPVRGRRIVYPHTKNEPLADPFMDYRQQVTFNTCANRSKRTQVGTQFRHLVVKYSPLALMGKWFNNNTYVDMVFTGTVALFHLSLRWWQVERVGFSPSSVCKISSNGQFAAMSGNSGSILVSSNCIDWVPLPVGIPDGGISAWADLPSCLLFTDDFSKLYRFVFEGHSVTQLPFPAAPFLASNGVLAMRSGSPPLFVETSANGVDWVSTGVTLPAASGSIFGVLGGFVFHGQDNVLYYSSDCSAWVPVRTMPAGAVVYSITLALDKWFLAYQDGGSSILLMGSTLGSMGTLFESADYVQHRAWATADGVEFQANGTETWVSVDGTSFTAKQRQFTDTIAGSAIIANVTAVVDFGGRYSHHWLLDRSQR